MSEEETNEETTNETIEAPVEQELSTQESLEKVVAQANKEGKGEPQPAQEPLPGSAESYHPNFKFKVLDNEHEFDEFIRPFIKNAETENKIRDLYTKAFGLDRYKTTNEELTTKMGAYEKQVGEYLPVIDQYKQLSQLAVGARNSGDFGQFFAAAQMNPKQVIQWAANTVAAQEKNPQHLQQQQQQYQQHFQAQQYQNQAQTYEQQNQMLQEQMYKQQLNYELMAPQNADFAKEFDSRAGTPGSFQKEVVQYGAMMEATTGQTLPPSQIVNELKARYQGFFNTAVSQAPSPSFPQEARQSLEKNNTQVGKPVIPHIKGKSQSPVKKEIRSTDDLRKLREANA